jgi:lantibiotic transport system permease protein
MSAISAARPQTRFIDALHGEWLKQRRSLAAWMVICGAFFTPTIILALRLYRYEGLPALYARPDFWTQLWHSAWESAAIFFLPMGAVLATSLIVQIEYRNNAWKQLRTLPIGAATIFFSKLAIVLSMLAQFLALFLLGIWLSAAIPAWIVPGLAMPAAPLPIAAFLRDLTAYFVACLPIIALQYALGLHLRNFIAPLGIGFMLWVASLAALSSRWGVLSPYAYTILEYLKHEPDGKLPPPMFDIHALALAYALLFVAIGYALFAMRRQKG